MMQNNVIFKNKTHNVVKYVHFKIYIFIQR